MMLHIPGALSPDEATHCRQQLLAADWIAGARTAGPQAAASKHNLQLPSDSPLCESLGQRIVNALQALPLFISGALPCRILPPAFNRYEAGGLFGNHVDNAIRTLPGGQVLRADLSITVFLSDPDSYEGGDLVVEDTYGSHEVKLPAGDAIVYPSTSLHRVEPVTQGMRLAAFLWVQSLVRDDAQRAMLFDLDVAIQQLRARIGDCPEVIALTSHYHNLLRRWAET
jgi:PKHD-type hydroxylase